MSKKPTKQSRKTAARKARQNEVRASMLRYCRRRRLPHALALVPVGYLSQIQKHALAKGRAAGIW